MNRLLIVGGSGFFGKSIIDYGIKKNLIKHKINKIYIIARKKQDKKKIKYKHLEINFISKDFNKIKKIPEVEFIIYCIKNNSLIKSNEYFEKFKKLILKFKKKPKILFTSSGAIYGKNKNKIKLLESKKIDFKKINNLNGYKKKYALEKLFIENKFKDLTKLKYDVTIARCFNFIGKHILKSNQAIAEFINDGFNKSCIKLKTSDNIYRGFMHADDLSNWLIYILKKANKTCPIYNVGSDKKINLKLLGQKISKIFKKKFKSNQINNQNIDYYVPSINKAKKILNLKISINLNDALNSTINFK